MYISYLTMYLYFFFNDTATTEIYTLSLHDALPILLPPRSVRPGNARYAFPGAPCPLSELPLLVAARSEEHTSELQSQFHLVCRLLLEKKKKFSHFLYYISDC